jgi:hypothetical protein
MDSEFSCPACSKEMTYIKDWPMEGHATSSGFTVKLASFVYECSEHGTWRIYISGAYEKVERIERQ